MAQPVIPVRSRPGRSQLLPERPREHPAEAWEEIAAEQASYDERKKEKPTGIVHVGDLAIVVPGADAVESGIGPEDGTGGVEVLEEVGRDFEIVLKVRRDGRVRLRG